MNFVLAFEETTAVNGCTLSIAICSNVEISDMILDMILVVAKNKLNLVY